MEFKCEYIHTIKMTRGEAEQVIELLSEFIELQGDNRTAAARLADDLITGLEL